MKTNTYNTTATISTFIKEEDLLSLHKVLDSIKKTLNEEEAYELASLLERDIINPVEIELMTRLVCNR